MKILFLARHYTYLRLFESAIEGLAVRGHEVVLAADRKEQIGGQAMIERLASRFPNVRLVQTPRRRDEREAEIARQVRLGIDYLRFLRPEFAQTPHLRARARERAPRVVVRWSESPVAGLMGGVDGIGAGLRLMERGLPVPPEVEEFLRAEAPDLVMITPLVDVGSSQLDFLPPHESWDCGPFCRLAAGTTSRARRSFATCQTGYSSGTTSRRVRRSRCTACPGARRGDGRAMLRSLVRSAAGAGPRDFARHVGLPDDRPFVLWVCSALFPGSPSEADFVMNWAATLRSSADARLRDVGILIRPHPSRRRVAGMDLSVEPRLLGRQSGR